MTTSEGRHEAWCELSCGRQDLSYFGFNRKWLGITVRTLSFCRFPSPGCPPPPLFDSLAQEWSTIAGHQRALTSTVDSSLSINILHFAAQGNVCISHETLSNIRSTGPRLLPSPPLPGTCVHIFLPIQVY